MIWHSNVYPRILMSLSLALSLVFVLVSPNGYINHPYKVHLFLCLFCFSNLLLLHSIVIRYILSRKILILMLNGTNLIHIPFRKLIMIYL